MKTKRLLPLMLVSTLAVLVHWSLSQQEDLIPVEVAEVLDGDTFVLTLSIDGSAEVRYVGIDTPETTNCPECYGIEAKEFHKKLLEGKKVWIEKAGKDSRNRLLAYVYLDPDGKQMVNELLVAEGYAMLLTKPYLKNAKNVDRLLQLQSQAQKTEKGLWKECVAKDRTVTLRDIQYAGADEVVTIVNNGKSPVEMKNWRLMSKPGNEQCYFFPRDFLLSAGASVRVHSGPQASGKADTQTDLYWTTQYIWNNDGDRGMLLDQNWKIVSLYEY